MPTVDMQTVSKAEPFDTNNFGDFKAQFVHSKLKVYPVVAVLIHIKKNRTRQNLP